MIALSGSRLLQPVRAAAADVLEAVEQAIEPWPDRAGFLRQRVRRLRTPRRARTIRPCWRDDSPKAWLADAASRPRRSRRRARSDPRAGLVHPRPSLRIALEAVCATWSHSTPHARGSRICSRNGRRMTGLNHATTGTLPCGTGCGLVHGVLTEHAPAGSARLRRSSSRPRVEGAAASSRPRQPDTASARTARANHEPSSRCRSRRSARRWARRRCSSLRTIDERPPFRIQIQEKQKLEELLATLKFKPVPVPAGGIYMAEQNRIMFPWVDNPLRQQLRARSASPTADHPDREPGRQMPRRQGAEQRLEGGADERRGGGEGRSPQPVAQCMQRDQPQRRQASRSAILAVR